MPSPSLGLDLGGTNIKAVLLTADGTVVQRLAAPTPPGGGAEAVTAALAAVGSALAAGRTLSGVGVAVPGVVDAARGVVRFLPNVPGEWDGRPLAAELGAALGAPAALLNDVRAATYGELRFGAGRGCSHFVMIAVGTGIGGGLVVDGDLYLGAGGHAGEVGHQVLDLHGPRCGCGGWGCAEALASGPALGAAAARTVAQGMTTALRAACGGQIGRLTPHLVAEVAAAGDPVAQELLDQEAERLGVLAGNLTVLLNPQRVVVGGGVAQAGAPLLEGIRRTMAARIGWYLRYAPVEVVPAALGEEAGALGAAAWAGRGQA